MMAVMTVMPLLSLRPLRLGLRCALLLWLRARRLGSGGCRLIGRSLLIGGGLRQLLLLPLLEKQRLAAYAGDGHG